MNSHIFWSVDRALWTDGHERGRVQGSRMLAMWCVSLCVALYHFYNVFRWGIPFQPNAYSWGGWQDPACTVCQYTSICVQGSRCTMTYFHMFPSPPPPTSFLPLLIPPFPSCVSRLSLLIHITLDVCVSACASFPAAFMIFQFCHAAMILTLAISMSKRLLV